MMEQCNYYGKILDKTKLLVYTDSTNHLQKVDYRYPKNEEQVQQAIADGYLPCFRLNSKPIIEDGYERMWKVYVDDGKLIKEYLIKRISDCLPPTVEDYDAAMEDYLVSVRTSRGYTTREPSDYISSGNERWRTDAQDWIAFRDNVMEYALYVQNNFINGKEIPSLNDFIKNMPQIVWTMQ